MSQTVAFIAFGTREIEQDWQAAIIKLSLGSKVILRFSIQISTVAIIAISWIVLGDGGLHAQTNDFVQTVKVSNLGGVEVFLQLASNGLRIISTLIGIIFICIGLKGNAVAKKTIEWSRKKVLSGLFIFLSGLCESYWVFSDKTAEIAIRWQMLGLGSLSAILGLMIVVWGFKGAARPIGFGVLCLILGFDLAAAIDWLLLNSRALNLS